MINQIDLKQDILLLINKMRKKKKSKPKPKLASIKVFKKRASYSQTLCLLIFNNKLKTAIFLIKINSKISKL